MLAAFQSLRISSKNAIARIHGDAATTIRTLCRTPASAPEPPRANQSIRAATCSASLLQALFSSSFASLFVSTLHSYHPLNVF